MSDLALTGVRQARAFIVLSVLCLLLALVGGYINFRPTLLIVWTILLFAMLRKSIVVKELIIIFVLVGPLISNRFAYKFGPVPDLSFDRLIAALALVPELIERRREGEKWIIQALDRRILLLILVAVVSIVFSFMIKTPIRVLIDSLITPFIMLMVVRRYAQDEWFLRTIYHVCIVNLLILGTIGLAQRVTHKELYKVEDGDDKFPAGRIDGPAGDSENFGLENTLLLLVVTNVGGVMRDPPGWVRLRVAGIAIGVLSVFNTLTRGEWIALALGLLAQLGLSLRKSAGVVIAMVLLLPFAMPLSSLLFSGGLQKRLEDMGTVYARIATYQSALLMFRDHPFLGVGYGAYEEAYLRGRDQYETYFNNVVGVRQPHNAYLVTLVETGIPGLLLFLVVLGTAISYAAKVRRWDGDPVHRAFAAAAICALVAYIGDGFGHDFTRNIAYINKLLFIIIGISAGFYQGLQERARLSSESVTG